MMFTHGLVKDGRNNYGNRDPRSIGAAASPLMEVVEGGLGHEKRVKLSDAEKKLVRFWIESGAVYPGTYGALGSGMVTVKYPEETIRKRCASCHAAKEKPKRNFKKGAFYYQFGERKPPQPLLNDINDIKSDSSYGLFRLGDSRLYQSYCNMDNPEASLFLLAPLAKEAGGSGFVERMFLRIKMIRIIRRSWHRLIRPLVNLRKRSVLICLIFVRTAIILER